MPRWPGIWQDWSSGGLRRCDRLLANGLYPARGEPALNRESRVLEAASGQEGCVESVVSLGNYAVAGFAVIVLVALGIFVGVGQVTDVEQKSLDAVTAANDARDHLQRLVSSLEEAERGARGFVLTNDALLLGPFQDAEVQIGKQLAALAEHVSEPDARQVLGAITAATDEQRQYHSGLIASREQSDSVAAADIFRRQAEGRRMDAIRVLIDQLDSYLTATLQQRLADGIAAAGRTEGLVRWLIVAGVHDGIVRRLPAFTRTAVCCP